MSAANEGLGREVHAVGAPRAALLFAGLQARQLLRGRVGWVAAVAAVAGLGLAALAGQGAVREHGRIVADFSLTAMQLAVDGVAIAAAVGGAAGDAAGRLSYTWLARPVSRGALLVGRFFGLWTVLLALSAAMAAAGALNLLASGAEVPRGFFAAAAMTAVEGGVLAAVCTLLVTVVSPPLAAAAAVVALAAGHFDDAWSGLAANGGRAPAAAQLAHAVLPDFARLSLRGWAAADAAVPAEVWLHGGLYGLAYVACTLSVASWAYGRRASL